MTSMSEQREWRSTFNQTSNDEMWNDIEIYRGVVALDNEFVDSNHIHRGSKFPWDDTKTVYVLNAFHSLHCLVRNQSLVVCYR